MSAKLTLKIETPGLDRLNGSAKPLGDLVMRIAGDVRDQAKAAITQGEKTGHQYLVPIRGNARWVRYEGGDIPDGWKLHQASAPGEAPAGETGNLANSIQAQRTGPLSAEVSVSAEYAFIELGTSKIAARPYLAPALDAASPALEAGARAILRGHE